MSNSTVARNTLSLIDKWLDFGSWYFQIPSLAVGIQIGEEVLFEQAYGFANLDDRTPATPETLYRIASHSKLFTATAIMRLHERGALRLDDPIAQHVDWFASDADDNSRFITIRRTRSGSVRTGGSGSSSCSSRTSGRTREATERTHSATS